MTFRHLLIFCALLSFAGWYTLARNATKSDKMERREIERLLKSGVDQVNGLPSQQLNDWLHIDKTELGPDWFGLVMTASRANLPNECQPSVDAGQSGASLPDGCIKRDMLRQFYCQAEDLRKLPTSDGIMNDITVTYEIRFDDAPGRAVTQGQFPFKSCKGWSGV